MEQYQFALISGHLMVNRTHDSLVISNKCDQNPHTSLRSQVKVWFQNRRTKYKRQKLEEEGPESHQKKKGNHHINRWRIATKQNNSEDIDVTSED